MSQRRRRRRRRGRGGGSGRAAAPTPESQQTQPGGPARGKRRRRRRGRGKAPSSPRSSEDLVRALPGERPESLTAPPDGQKLEDLIGELQSTWGVPQYPQEYRLLLKVADPRDRVTTPARTEREKPEEPTPSDGQPRREKAPPRQQMDRPESSAEPRRRRRRRRRKKGEGGDEGG